MYVCHIATEFEPHRVNRIKTSFLKRSILPLS
jgi:hypothetical protein